ncbi:MAG: DNA-protecting protein DprA [bacterium]|nr:DNA-protecting protein DprA [bacterium]
MTNSELKERLIDSIALLNVPGIGGGRFGKLVSAFGSPKAALAAKISQLERVSGISRSLASAVKEHGDGERARQTAARIIQLGWTVLFSDQPEYPQKLAPVSDAPPMLFRVGEVPASDSPMIGIVGTRHASEGGRRFAYRLAGDLAREGITVVSGMAEGIDSAAHKGALDAGGATIAVWGTPLDQVYPKTNRELAEQIKAQGAVYSEYLPDTEPNPAHFPERNRIISGLSEGVVVIEAGKKSGALITARCALDQERELFAVPGPPDAGRSFGANELIKSGARLLTGIEDIFEELPRLKGEVSARKFRQMPELTETEVRMVDLLSSGPLQIDNLSREAALPVSEAMEFLLALELKGVVQELPGKRFVLTEQ